MKRRRRLLILLASLVALFLLLFSVASVLLSPPVLTAVVRAKLHQLVGRSSTVSSAEFIPVNCFSLHDFYWEQEGVDRPITFRAGSIRIDLVLRTLLSGRPTPERILMVDPVLEVPIDRVEVSGLKLHEIEGVDFDELGGDIRHALEDLAALNPFLPDLTVVNAVVRIREDSPSKPVLELSDVEFSGTRQPSGRWRCQGAFSDHELGDLRFVGSCDVPKGRADFGLTHSGIGLSG